MKKKRKTTYSVTQTDDEGTRTLINDASTARNAAARAAALDPAINEFALASSWSFHTGSAYYQIGQNS